MRFAGPLLTAIALAAGAASAAATCPAPGEWHGADGQRLDASELFRELAQNQVVLLGEQHDRLEHHRWQLHTLAALHAYRPDMVIGLEMLPREAQPALDAWVAGDLSESEFIARSDWNRAWGFEPQLYLPILHFARMHRVPVRGVNFDRALVARLAAEGWDAVPAEERYGVTAPAAASEGYLDYLGQVLKEHPTGAEDGGDIDRFAAGQLVWDRAMAAGLAEAAREGALVVGLMGSGHVAHGYGVPHQLRDLGIERQRSLVPWNAADNCASLQPGIADVVFGTAGGNLHEPPKPMLLGVRIEADPAGVRVQAVVPDSVAKDAGLEAGDILTVAAGRSLALPGDLVTVIRRQVPGAVLPLTVLRDGEFMEVLARFPAQDD